MTQCLEFRGCVKLVIHYFPKVCLSVVLLIWQAMEKFSFSFCCCSTSGCQGRCTAETAVVKSAAVDIRVVCTVFGTLNDLKKIHLDYARS